MSDTRVIHSSEIADDPGGFTGATTCAVNSPRG
jgi:hypothetical protein